MKLKSILTIFFIFSFMSLAFSCDDHDHKEHDEQESEAEHKHDEKKDEHKHEEKGHAHDEEGHGHGEEEGEHSEENAQVGPEKGILEASEVNGIKLSPQAEKNFEITKLKVGSGSSHNIPKSAVVTAGTEVNLYRIRNGFYKRIDFEILKRTGTHLTVKSKDLKDNDEIVVTGLGFLRIAEIAAFGGAPEGHSH
jgi:Ni/Co efflux regulator RcnB